MNILGKMTPARVRDLIVQLTRRGEQAREGTDLRRLSLGTIALAKAGRLRATLGGMSEVAGLVHAETGGWREPEEIAGGAQGHFDVCDLRIWLMMAERAGIPAIPAREILSLRDEELEAILPKYQLPEPLRRRLEAAIRTGLGADRPDPETMDAGMMVEEVPDRAALLARVTSALDDIPASWMVRTHLGGSSMLKALVGTGLMLKGDDTGTLAPGVVIGAGWVQSGNRRYIDFANDRFLSLSPGHKEVTHYLARPWVAPGRFHDGEDLHRANSPLAGPGRWPAEWRAFIRNGRVSGVANYYGWTGDGATAENAWNAIEAGAMAQEIADQVAASGLVGRYMDSVLWRMNPHPDTARAFAAIDPDRLQATLDFLEAEDGLVFLEGGPGHMPGGGGHPCAFAGQGVVPGDPERHVARCEGVAYRNMPHASLADPTTWVDGDPDGAIETWEAAAQRARSHAAPSPRARRFLEARGVLPEEAPEP